MEAKENASSASIKKATFAGGCFWCMEPPFEALPGVLSVTAGYTGGRLPGPTYDQVLGGKTGHAEAVEILYDADRVPYAKLLDIFWQNIDPTTPDRQFADVGEQYRTVIFYHDDEQKQMAIASRARLEKSKRFRDPLVTAIEPAGEFYPAEEYHQDYYKKKPVHYQLYKRSSGREAFLKENWKAS